MLTSFRRHQSKFVVMSSDWGSGRRARDFCRKVVATCWRDLVSKLVGVASRAFSSDTSRARKAHWASAMMARNLVFVCRN